MLFSTFQKKQLRHFAYIIPRFATSSLIKTDVLMQTSG
jgi:hypothetical protein